MKAVNSRRYYVLAVEVDETGTQKVLKGFPVLIKTD